MHTHTSLRALTAMAASLALAATLVACTQSGGPTAEATTEGGEREGGIAPEGPVIGHVSAWIREHAILLWQPSLDQPGVYEFSVQNHGRFPHDFTIVRWDGDVARMPERSGRVRLEAVEIIARSPVIEPGHGVELAAELPGPGTYALFSAEGTDYGQGMVAALAVGRPEVVGAQPVPIATPPPQDSATVAVYLVDGSVFTSRDAVDDGRVVLRIHNLGADQHDLLVLRWRGEAHTLPVDGRGELLLDALTVVARTPVLSTDGQAEVEFTADEEMGYALVCSLPGHYDAGMGITLTVR